VSSNLPNSTTGPGSVKIDILVVDDSESDAQLTLLALKRLQPQLQALWLNNSRQAVDYLMCRRRRSRALPSLVLTDVHMPAFSGLELLAMIRVDPRLRALPVIMLSGHAAPAEIQECYRLGIASYVEKSVEYETFSMQLLQAVTTCLSIARVIDPS